MNKRLPGLIVPCCAAACAAACTAACAAGPAGAEPEWNWYRNDTQCGTAKVTVRSHCAPMDEADRAGMVAPANHQCDEQALHIAVPGKRSVKLDLRKYERGDEELRIATSLRCVAAGKQHYLFVLLSNGGNCDTCETSAVLSLDGRWKAHGDTWLSASPNERKAIEAVRGNWLRVPAHYINNMQRADEE